MSNRFTKYTADKLRADGWLDKEQAATLRTRLQQVESERDKALEAHDKEIGDLQNEVRNLVIDLSGAPDYAIDGAGSDAGWQEFTLAEISQGLAYLKDQLDKAEAERDVARKLLSDWGYVFIGDWVKRRDTFLNPKPQDVM